MDMDRFLERARTDLMYELRNMQHGERPVTGHNRRESLQKFMEKRMGFSHNSSDGKRNIPANIDNVEIHRPEAVVVEVQAVVDLQPVTSVLQSVSFRRHLENVIRRSLSSGQPARNVNPSISPSSSASNVVCSPLIIPEARQLNGDRQPLARQESSESVDSFTSARSSYEEGIESDEEELEVAVASPEVSQGSASARPGLSSVSDSQRISWNDISTLHREEIVEEISELLHSRLVTSTLQGEFRTVLEMVAQNHLSSSGTNGRAVQEFIQTLPHSGVQRNDFSHLGVMPIHENDNWDNISVTSVSAHSVPYAQTNTYLGREIQSLKSQMNEMKNMLKLTFDLQMDIQRAVRQEVAAAMNNFAAQGATGVSASVPKSSQPICDAHCLICLDRHTDSVLYQCGHMCVCFVCGRNLVSRGHKCPVCRAPIKDVIRAYRTNAE